MRKIMKFSGIFTLAGCLIFSSCNKKDDPFAGSDNYIASFALSKGDRTVNALISATEILVAPPSGYSLNGAVASVSLSENATIKPNPASISDWEKEYVFVVTSHNGSTRSYTYRISETENEVDGTIVLATQSEVDAFGDSGVTAIRGSLVIGAASGRDSISSIAPLNRIKTVGYGVCIKSTYAGRSLDGLTALQSVGGVLRIETSGLKEARFPALNSAMSIEAVSKTLEALECPKLTFVSDRILISNVNLSKLDMPALEKVDGNITFEIFERTDLSALTRIAFPALKIIGETFSVGKHNVGGLARLTAIDLPELTDCGGLRLSDCATLSSVSMPKLENIKGDILYERLAIFADIDLPLLKHAGSLKLTDCSEIESINAPRLETVDGDLKTGVFIDMTPDGFSHFAALNTVGGIFEIVYAHETSMPILKLPPVLRNCGTLDLADCVSLERIDLTGINVNELILRTGSLLNLTIKGDRAFNGTISMYTDDVSRIATLPYIYRFPVFEGIEELGNLHITMQQQRMPTLAIAGIGKIKGNLKLERRHYNNSGETDPVFSVQDLGEVGGNIVSINMRVPFFQFGSIRKVGGDIVMGSVEGHTFGGETLSFPLLTEAGGLHVYASDNVTGNILTPQLTTITNSLIIMASTSASRPGRNTVMTNVDGLSSLRNVKTVNIERMDALVSYEGLKNCLNSLTDENQWKLLGNGYNPSLADMKDGKWIPE